MILPTSVKFSGRGCSRAGVRATDGFVQVCDDRDPAHRKALTLEGPLATVFRALSDRPVPLRKLIGDLDLGSRRGEIEAGVAGLCEHRVIMRDGDYYLALPLPARRGR